MSLITSITIRTHRNANGRQFDQVRVWVAGMPFSADLTDERMERVVRRIAKEAGVEVDDYRKLGVST